MISQPTTSCNRIASQPHRIPLHHFTSPHIRPHDITSHHISHITWYDGTSNCITSRPIPPHITWHDMTSHDMTSFCMTYHAATREIAIIAVIYLSGRVEAIVLYGLFGPVSLRLDGTMKTAWPLNDSQFSSKHITFFNLATNHMTSCHITARHITSYHHRRHITETQPATTKSSPDKTAEGWCTQKTRFGQRWCTFSLVSTVFWHCPRLAQELLVRYNADLKQYVTIWLRVWLLTNLDVLLRGARLAASGHLETFSVQRGLLRRGRLRWKSGRQNRRAGLFDENRRLFPRKNRIEKVFEQQTLKIFPLFIVFLGCAHELESIDMKPVKTSRISREQMCKYASQCARKSLDTTNSREMRRIGRSSKPFAGLRCFIIYYVHDDASLLTVHTVIAGAWCL